MCEKLVENNERYEYILTNTLLRLDDSTFNSAISNHTGKIYQKYSPAKTAWGNTAFFRRLLKTNDAAVDFYLSNGLLDSIATNISRYVCLRFLKIVMCAREVYLEAVLVHPQLWAIVMRTLKHGENYVARSRLAKYLIKACRVATPRQVLHLIECKALIYALKIGMHEREFSLARDVRPIEAAIKKLAKTTSLAEGKVGKCLELVEEVLRRAGDRMALQIDG